MNITGSNFGPLSENDEAMPITIVLTSDYNVSLCTEPRVIVEDTVISCLAQPNLRPSNVTVIFDEIESIPSTLQFTYFDNAGNFSFEREEFTISETELFANVMVTRHNYSPYPSPAAVSLQVLDGTAISGRHFEAVNTTFYLESNMTKVVVTIPITYGNYQPEQLRKGADDDVVVNLRISEVISTTVQLIPTGEWPFCV